jgi:hypothetical protein
MKYLAIIGFVGASAASCILANSAANAGGLLDDVLRRGRTPAAEQAQPVRGRTPAAEQAQPVRGRPPAAAAHHRSQ